MKNRRKGYILGWCLFLGIVFLFVGTGVGETLIGKTILKIALVDE